jgi:hypothetical protein
VVSGFIICALGEICSILSPHDIRPEVLMTSGIIGLLVGGFVGSRIRRERWADVTVERLDITFWPSGSGSVSLGFGLLL